MKNAIFLPCSPRCHRITGVSQIPVHNALPEPPPVTFCAVCPDAAGGERYPSDFRMFKRPDFAQPTDGYLLAVQMPEGFELYVSDSDTLVIVVTCVV